MTIAERDSGRVVVLDVGGSMTIDAVSDMPLGARVRRLVQEGHRQILLNLAGVPYVDTTGLCNIVEAYVATERGRGSLKLLHLTPPVRRVLATTRLLGILDAYESEADALASFGR
jgi:anti-sigma B factor antagonist